MSYTPGFEIISCQLCELESNVASLPSCCCFSEMGHYQYLTYRIFVHVLLLREVSGPLKGEAATLINVMIPTIRLPFTMCVTLIKFPFCILISLSINLIKCLFCRVFIGILKRFNRIIYMRDLAHGRRSINIFLPSHILLLIYFYVFFYSYIFFFSTFVSILHMIFPSPGSLLMFCNH